jgi:hypothetical protein
LGSVFRAPGVYSPERTITSDGKNWKAPRRVAIVAQCPNPVGDDPDMSLPSTAPIQVRANFLAAWW